MWNEPAVAYPMKEWNIAGKKLAIVGYSHHSDADYTSDFTQQLVADVASGQCRKAFFTRISSYFGILNQDFWPHVLFFNFLPSRIGTSNEKYQVAEQQHPEGRSRVERIMKDTQPDRILVFSTKAWNYFPNTDAENLGQKCSSLYPASQKGLYRVEVGAYTVDGRAILAAGFRHPERADRKQMEKAVKTFMSIESLTSPASDESSASRS